MIKSLVVLSGMDDSEDEKIRRLKQVIRRLNTRIEVLEKQSLPTEAEANKVQEELASALDAFDDTLKAFNFAATAFDKQFFNDYGRLAQTAADFLIQYFDNRPYPLLWKKIAQRGV
jgi:hypothetical protein